MITKTYAVYSCNALQFKESKNWISIEIISFLQLLLNIHGELCDDVPHDEILILHSSFTRPDTTVCTSDGDFNETLSLEVFA